MSESLLCFRISFSLPASPSLPFWIFPSLSQSCSFSPLPTFRYGQSLFSCFILIPSRDFSLSFYLVSVLFLTPFVFPISSYASLSPVSLDFTSAISLSHLFLFLTISLYFSRSLFLPPHFALSLSLSSTLAISLPTSLFSYPFLPPPQCKSSSTAFHLSPSFTHLVIPILSTPLFPFSLINSALPQNRYTNFLSPSRLLFLSSLSLSLSRSHFLSEHPFTRSLSSSHFRTSSVLMRLCFSPCVSQIFPLP